jgi:hypothetical protein
MEVNLTSNGILQLMEVTILPTAANGSLKADGSIVVLCTASKDSE